MKYILFFFSVTFYGQTLHHQMLSSQGSSSRTSSGLLVKQTIGQQSTVGNKLTENFTVIQGFQQSYWSSHITSNKVDVAAAITTLTYPNPFIDYINFQFSKPISDEIAISIFDILGRIIYQDKRKIDDNILTIDLARFPTAQFLVRLSANDFNYYTKINKQ